jgi:hypothetical protein
MIDERQFVQNIFPTKVLALTTAALAIVHWAFALRGRVVVGVAGLWAMATTWMVAMFVFESGDIPSQRHVGGSGSDKEVGLFVVVVGGGGEGVGCGGEGVAGS